MSEFPPGVIVKFSQVIKMSSSLSIMLNTFWVDILIQFIYLKSIIIYFLCGLIFLLKKLMDSIMMEENHYSLLFMIKLLSVTKILLFLIKLQYAMEIHHLMNLFWPKVYYILFSCFIYVFILIYISDESKPKSSTPTVDVGNGCINDQTTILYCDGNKSYESSLDMFYDSKTNLISVHLSLAIGTFTNYFLILID